MERQATSRCLVQCGRLLGGMAVQGHPGLALVGFEDQFPVSSDAHPRVHGDGFARQGGRQRTERTANGAGDRPTVLFRYLIGDDDAIDLWRQCAQSLDQALLQGERGGAAVLDVLALGLALRSVRLHLHRLGVGGREALRRLDHRRGVHAVPLQGAQQLVTHPVLPDNAQRGDLHAQRTEVVGHGARRARAVTHIDDLVRGASGLQRALGQGGIDDQIAIQKIVPHDQDAQGGKAVQQRLQPALIHGGLPQPGRPG